MPINTPGEMFTHSFLKRLQPMHIALWALAFSAASILFARYVFSADNSISFAACFGIVFYAVANPIVFLFAQQPKKFFVQSTLLYGALILLLLLIVFLQSGENVFSNNGLRIILISTAFYYVVAYASIYSMRMFLDVSDGGM